MELPAWIPARHRYRIIRFLEDDATAARSLGVQVGEGCRILSSEVSSEPSLLSIDARSVVMPRTEIGDRWVAAAGSVVTRSAPAGRGVGGDPARITDTGDAFVDRVLTTWASSDQRRGVDRRGAGRTGPHRRPPEDQPHAPRAAAPRRAGRRCPRRARGVLA